MRIEGKVKLGFFPLSLAEAARIRRFLQFPAGHSSALDPCVGDGVAFAAIGSGRDVSRYGIELDAFRAEQAKATCAEIVQGNALDVACPVGSFSLVYENPPYDWEIGEGRNRRIEVVFLDHTYRWLKPEGVLILVVPAERVTDCSQILAGHFKNVRLYRLTEPASEQYRQVAVIGVRRSQRERERLQDSEIARARSYFTSLAYKRDQIPKLTDQPDCVFQVPEGGPVKLSYRGLPLDLIEDLLPKSPAYRQAAPILFADEEPIEGRPLTPLHGGHVGLLCTAGMLNGIFGEGQSRHIAHWQSVKVVDKSEEQNEDGTVTIREKERFTNELTLAFVHGKVTTLK